MNETEVTTPTPKRRGRPVGSKNRPKAEGVRKSQVLVGDGSHLKITSGLLNGGRLLIAKIELNGNTAAQVQTILDGMRGFKAVMGEVSEHDLKNLDREYVLVRTHGWG